jgi:hypothetical protein
LPYSSDSDLTALSVARRGRLRGQCRQPIHQGRDVVERAILRLQVGQTVVGVADTLREDRDLRTMRVGDGETGRIVARVVDAKTARQPLQRLVQTNARNREIRLRVDRGDVIDD